MRRVVAIAVTAVLAALATAGTASAHVDVLPAELARDQSTQLTDPACRTSAPASTPSGSASGSRSR